MVEDINKEAKENRMYLKGHKIPDGMRATQNLMDIVDHSHIILAVVPTPFLAKTVGKYYTNQTIVWLGSLFFSYIEDKDLFCGL